MDYSQKLNYQGLGCSSCSISQSYNNSQYTQFNARAFQNSYHHKVGDYSEKVDYSSM